MDAESKRRPFQFTLRRMLAATAFAACAWAAAGWIVRMPTNAPTNLAVAGVLLLILATGGFLGAAIGTLTRRIKKSVLWGIVVGMFVAVGLAIDWSPRTTKVVIPAGGTVVITGGKTNKPPPAAMPP